MAMRDFERLQKEARALPPAEQIMLAEYLLQNARATFDNEDGDLPLAGSIRLTIDPLEYQRQVRAEWP